MTAALDQSWENRYWERNWERCSRGHPLIRPNLRADPEGRGHFNCLACGRARDYVHYHPGADLQTEADRYFAEIMEHGSGYRRRESACRRGHPLTRENVRRKKRTCKACELAYTYCRRHTGADIRAEADRYYLELTLTTTETP